MHGLKNLATANPRLETRDAGRFALSPLPSALSFLPRRETRDAGPCTLLSALSFLPRPGTPCPLPSVLRSLLFNHSII